MGDIMLIDIARIVWRKIWLVISAAVVCAAIAFTYCNFFATPVYSTKVSMVTGSSDSMFQNPNEALSTGTLSTSLAMINTYVRALKLPAIYDLIKEETGLEYSRKQLMGMVSVTNTQESLFIDITVKCTNGGHAQIIANKFAEIAPEYLKSLMTKSSAKTAEWADTVSKVSPKTSLSVVIAGFLGALVVAILAIVIETLDQTIKGEEDFVAHYDVPVLGIVPNFDTYKANSKGGKYNG
ncbi:MAG: Wzz/FepE/Etk N-terminal domain-containing protein [Oscillospiraceae bacterium]